MPRDIPVGNGSLLVTFDGHGLLRDIFFPHVGQENHASMDPFRIGVWVNGAFSWVPDGWETRVDYLDDSLVTNVEMRHGKTGLRLTMCDVVDFHENIYLKQVTALNESGADQEIRIFFCHDFNIYGNEIGDTAAFRPEVNGILHYKNDRYFLVNAFANRKGGLDQFATGNKRRGQFEGTWRDAEDGVLSGNPIAQGSVDSVAAVRLHLQPGGSDVFHYWICAGTNWAEVCHLNETVLKRTPAGILNRTRDYWKLWIGVGEINYDLLPPALGRLYRRSLLIIRTQVDDSGSIIAANDSDNVYYNRDTYSYMWPRDGALVARALDLAGYPEITRRFFRLCSQIIEKEGYFLHKYTPSGSPASSWHPWQQNERNQLPIQEDETALVIWALWRHFAAYGDVEFIKPLYRPLIKSAADFMMTYRDSETGLPLPSYDLWEERRGVLTFTASAVHGGLTAAAHFASAFGETELADEYRLGAQRLREAMDRHLFLPDRNRFARMINISKGGATEVDSTLDASLYGTFGFGAYPPDDPRVAATMAQVRATLWCPTPTGGIARYENDPYHRTRSDVPGNPWFVTTLWLAQYHVARATSRQDLEPAMELLNWVADRAAPSGVLAEQIDPDTNAPLSVSPLTWSHAAFVTVVQEYLKTVVQLDRCPSCGHPLHSRKKQGVSEL